jgi:hypothetical protein
VTAEELKANKESATFHLCADHLDNKDVFGKSDPYFILSKLVGHGKFAVVKKSEVVMNDLNPSWDGFTIPVRDLCNNDYDRNEWTSHQMEKGTFFVKIKLSCFSYFIQLSICQWSGCLSLRSTITTLTQTTT